MTAPKVAIGIPYYKTWDGDMGMSFGGLMARSAAHVKMLPIKCTGCYIEENRNGIVNFALDTGHDFDWFLWIDSDMIFPDDALLRLIAHDKDIIGANYRQRMPPYSFTGWYDDDTDAHIMEPGLHRMKHLPAGFMLVRFDIYRKLAYPWYRAPREKNEPRDEVYFCKMAREAGYEIWCDHDLTKQIVHIGDQMIPWFNEGQVKTIRGAHLNQMAAETEARERAEKLSAA
jgi:hypothetical protein